MSFEKQPLSIAERVLGISDNLTPDESMQAGYEKVMSTEPMSQDSFSFLFEQFSILQMFGPDVPGVMMSDPKRGGQASPEYTNEARMAALSVCDVVTSGSINFANSLVDWPAYQQLMKDHGKKIGGVALMIGAISPMSTMAFEAIAEDEYGADHAVTVDVAGSSAKARQGNFLYGSGTELPFADESISYVHTNRLLHVLQYGGDIWREDGGVADTALFSEISRVLRPGGQLLMVESLPSRHHDNPRGLEQFMDRIRKQLDSQEFEGIHIDNHASMLSKTYLFDRTRNFGKHLVGLNRVTADVFARKPV